MSELPQGWVRINIGDVAEVNSGFGFPERFQGKVTGDFPFAKVRDISFAYRNKCGRLSAADNYVTHRDLLELKARPVPTGSVVFAKIGEALRLNRRVLLEQDTIIDNNCMAVTGDRRAIEAEFLYQFMTTVDLSPFAVATTVPSVRRGDVESIELPLPPLLEQRRIVTKINSLTGKSNRARDHLDHIPRLVEKYKQAVLAAAFRGQLIGLPTTETELLHNRCWDLPASWRWVRFSEVVEIASNLVKPAEITNLPHIAPDNVESGTGQLLPFRTIGEDGVISAKHRFFAGQVIYSKIRPYLRKAVLVDFDGACSADMYPLTANNDLNTAYLLHWLISEPFANFTVEHEGRTVLPKINQQGLNQTPIPLPPLPDQLEIVRRLRTAFNWIDRLASEATSARRLVDRLDQAVLAKAFRGELVPQDPNDEPAAVILERIEAERLDMPETKRKRRKKAP